MTTPALMTPEEAAAALGISGRQLRDLTADGAIPYIDIGRGKREARRYEPSDIEAFKSERRKTACPSISVPAQRRTATTSASKVYDIQTFKGVHKQAGRDLWYAAIRLNGKQKKLGYFKTQEEAALAYDTAAKEAFGVFARPNCP